MHKQAIGLHVRVILEKIVNLHWRGFGHDFLRFSQANGYAGFTEILYLFNRCGKRLDYIEHIVMQRLEHNCWLLKSCFEHNFNFSEETGGLISMKLFISFNTCVKRSQVCIILSCDVSKEK